MAPLLYYNILYYIILYYIILYYIILYYIMLYVFRGKFPKTYSHATIMFDFRFLCSFVIDDGVSVSCLEASPSSDDSVVPLRKKTTTGS